MAFIKPTFDESMRRHITTEKFFLKIIFKSEFLDQMKFQPLLVTLLHMSGSSIRVDVVNKF